MPCSGDRVTYSVALPRVQGTMARAWREAFDTAVDQVRTLVAAHWQRACQKEHCTIEALIRAPGGSTVWAPDEGFELDPAGAFGISVHVGRADVTPCPF